MRLFVILISLFAFSCEEETKVVMPVNLPAKNILRAVDLSALPEIEATNAKFFNLAGEEENILTILKNNGVNTIRLRLWHNPTSGYSSFESVKSFADRLHNLGFELCLAIHYSDTWADPSQQATPTVWEDLGFSELKDSLYHYTRKIISEIKPEYVQIGNELNSGLLFPYGDIQTAENQFLDLIKKGVEAIKAESESAQIIIHFAGMNGADWFFNKLQQVDYDIIGLSYYPIWHGKEIDQLSNTIVSLHQNFQKEIFLVETAYPFTLGWNDFTNNIVGLEEQLILPDFPASPIGQRDFLNKIKNVVHTVDGAIGFCYWGGELIAFKGPLATDGSVWENQALFDFEQQALPIIEVFKEK